MVAPRPGDVNFLSGSRAGLRAHRARFLGYDVGMNDETRAAFAAITAQISTLAERMDSRFDDLTASMVAGFGQLSARLSELEARVGELEERLARAEEALDEIKLEVVRVRADLQMARRKDVARVSALERRVSAIEKTLSLR